MNTLPASEAAMLSVDLHFSYTVLNLLILKLAGFESGVKPLFFFL